MDLGATRGPQAAKFMSLNVPRDRGPYAPKSYICGLENGRPRRFNPSRGHQGFVIVEDVLGHWGI